MSTESQQTVACRSEFGHIDDVQTYVAGWMRLDSETGCCVFLCLLARGAGLDLGWREVGEVHDIGLDR